MDVSRVVPVIRFVDGNRRVGSGYRVAGRLVLTAAHCLRGTGHRVWLSDGERTARVVVDGRRSATLPASDRSMAGVDLGLLEILPDPAKDKAPVAELPAPACARIDRTTSERLGGCVAIGYPKFKATTKRPFRTAQVDGWIPPASGLEDTAAGRHAGYLTLKAEGPPPAPLPTAEQELGRSMWAGMSGAAVYAGDRLVGVVAEHHLPEGDGSLTVVPIEWVDRLPKDDRAVALRALGLESVDNLVLLVAGAEARTRWLSVLAAPPPVLVDRPVVEAELRAAVLAAMRSPVVVWGMGGSGKSVLAGRLARAVQDGQDASLAAAFPDGVAWVRVGQERKIAAVQLELARGLGDNEPDLGDDWPANRARLQQLAAGRRGLVVLDDVWTLDRYEQLQLDVAGVRILVTTRNQALPSDLQAAAVPVGELERDQSRTLLARAAGTSVGRLPRQADAVLTELGDLALGVAMVGAIAKEQGSQAWAGLLQRLRAQRLDKVAHRFQDYEHATLLRAIDVAVDDLDPDDQQRWAELAVFAGQGPVPATALAALWHGHDDDTLDTNDRLRQFLRRSLVQQTRDGRYQLHDLQHDTARLRLHRPLANVHAQLLDGYRQRLGFALGIQEPVSWDELVNRLGQLAPGDSAWGDIDDGYVLDRLIHHLAAADHMPDVLRLLADYDWLDIGVTQRGVARLLADYAAVPTERPVQLVREALARGQHALRVEPPALPDQILGRLAELRDPPVVTLMARARQEQASRPFDIIRSGLRRPSGSLLHILSHHDQINAIAVTDNGRVLTASSYSTVIVWDLDTGQPLHTLTGHQGRILTVAVTGDGRVVTASWDDRTAIMWDLTRGQSIASWYTDFRVTALAWGDPQSTLTVGDNGGEVHILRLRT